MWFYIGLGIVVILSLYCWFGIKKAYEKGETLPLRVSIAIWVSDTVHFLLVLFASLDNTWLLPLNKIIALVSGTLMGVIGLIIMLAGMLEFRSLRKMSGLETSKLITTGIYRYSRNPQYTGWFLALLGISIMGRSGLALLLTIALIVGIHLYNVKLEEPYLERIFGEEYRRYKSSTPRYIGMPKKK
jgi:protein-S-isoprenylcysteine O-methyltransferase Ste14